MLNLFDQYDRRARLYPALLALMPSLSATIAWRPDLFTARIGEAIVVFLAGCGVLYFLAAISRSLGRKVEKRLLVVWGGWPTTIWLRHRDNHINAVTKERYHRFLQENVLGITMPSAQDEEARPNEADDTYKSSVEWLKERCRGPKYDLVTKEVTEYGFRRNMLGLRRSAVCIGCTTLLGSIIYAWLNVGDAPVTVFQPLRLIGVIEPETFAVAAIALSATILWLHIVTDAWVQEAGENYARALLACCDLLGINTKENDTAKSE